MVKNIIGIWDTEGQEIRSILERMSPSHWRNSYGEARGEGTDSIYTRGKESISKLSQSKFVNNRWRMTMHGGHLTDLKNIGVCPE